MFCFVYLFCFLSFTSSQEHETYFKNNEDFLFNENYLYENEELFIPNDNFEDHDRSLDAIGEKIDGKLAQLLQKGEFKIGLFNEFVSAVKNTLGVDIIAILDSLLSPEGVASQFLITFLIETFRGTGLIIAGVAYFFAVESTSGSTLDLVRELDFLLNPSSIARTLIRSIIRVMWELTARVVTTFVLFGVFETVNQFVTTLSISKLWGFISSPNTRRLFSGRFILGWLFVTIGFSILVQLGMAPAGNVALGRESSDSTSWPQIASF